MAIADLTPDQREQAEAFLEDAVKLQHESVKLQHEFWDTLSELERVAVTVAEKEPDQGEKE
jgi:hypothetical protein